MEPTRAELRPVEKKCEQTAEIMMREGRAELCPAELDQADGVCRAEPMCSVEERRNGQKSRGQAEKRVKLVVSEQTRDQTEKRDIK